MYTTSSLNVYMNVKAKYSDPYSEFVLYIYPSKVHTHSSEHTHTVGSHLCCGARGVVGVSVACSRAPHHGIEGGERALCIHSPHRQSLPDRDSNSQHLDYESDYLPLGHDFPLNKHAIHNLLLYYYIIPYNVIDLTFHFQLDSFIRIHSGPEKCTNACSFGRYDFKILILPEVIWQTYECQREGCKAISLKLRHS